MFYLRKCGKKREGRQMPNNTLWLANHSKYKHMAEYDMTILLK